MFFSVVIPLYNKEKTVLKTIKSVLLQTYTDFEIIVINDGSTDNSLKIVKNINDERIKIFSQKNKGVSSARNYGINESRANWIAFLDADDYWEKSYLQSFFKAINSFKNASFFFCGSLINSKKPINLINQNPFIIEHYFNQVRSRGISPNSSSVVVSKKVFFEVGFFDTDISIGEDTDMWYRSMWSFESVFIPTYLSHINIGDSGWVNHEMKVSQWFYTFIEWRRTNRISNTKQTEYKILFSKEMLKYLFFCKSKKMNFTFFEIGSLIPTFIRLFFVQNWFIRNIFKTLFFKKD